MGDAIGTFGGVMLGEDAVHLILASAGGFILCALLFFTLYHKLYMPRFTEQEASEKLLSEYEARCGFTARQSEIFRLVMQGRSNAEMSSELFLSENTVKFHIKNILRKTGCANRTELIARFRRENGA